MATTCTLTEYIQKQKARLDAVEKKYKHLCENTPDAWPPFDSKEMDSYWEYFIDNLVVEEAE